MRTCLFALLCCTAACFDFGVGPDEVTCGPGGECPSDLVCDRSVDRCVSPTLLPGTPDAGTGDASAPGPDTIIDAPSTGAATGTIVDVTFHASGDPAGVTFRCRLDAAAPAACSSPQRYTFTAGGMHTVRVAAVSPLGAVGAEASRIFSVDATGASVNLMGSVANGATTGMTSLTFTFTAVPSDNVSGFECSFDGATFAGCTSGGAGATATTTMERQHTFAVRAIRLGVTGVPSTWNWTLDTTAPQVAISAPTTSVASPARATLPAFTGSAENFAMVTLYRGTTCSGGAHSAAVAALSGSWTILATQGEGTSANADGETDYSARAVDLAGNAGCSAVFKYFTDNTPPAVAIGGTTPATSAAQPSTNRTPSVQGTAESGAVIGLYTGASCGGTPVGGGNAAGGTFNVGVTSALAADGTTTLYAKATDAAGNATCSAGFAYLTDNTPPNVSPSATSPATTSSTPSMNLRPTVSGSAETGATVTLYTGAGCFGAAYGGGTASGGTFSIATTTDATPTGTTTYYARAVDAAGNGACSASGVAYYTNNTAPSVSITGTTPATTSTTPSTNRLPTVAGNAPTSATVQIFTAAGCTGTAIGSTTAASNTFSVTVTAALAADGTTTLYAKATDTIGNSACSAGYGYYTDNTAPTVSISSTSPPTSSASPTQTRTPTVSGSAENGATVYLYNGVACTGGVKDGPVVASLSTGAWSIPASTVVADGATSFYAQAIDAAGNSACSAVFRYYTDNTAPSITVSTTTPSTTSTNPSKNRLPTVSVTTESGASVVLYGLSGCSGSAYSAAATAPSSSAFSIATTVSAPSDNGITYYARTTDAAGNARCSSSGVAYYTDNTAPAVSITGSNPSTSSASPSADRTPQVTVSSEAGASIALYTGVGCTGGQVGSGATGAGTTATITTSALNANGATTLYAQATDAATNAACSSGFTYYTDTSPPGITAVATNPATTSSQRTKTLQPNVLVQTEAGASVILYTMSGCSGTAVSSAATAPSASAFWMATTANAPSTGSVNYYAKATDPLGNSACSTMSPTYYTDNTLPVFTANSVPPNPTSSGTGHFRITVTEDSSFTLSCTLDGAAYACSSGVDTATYTMAPGAHVFSATATDSAGNVGTYTYNWTIDTWCVDRASGNDANLGYCGSPFKTITKALASAGSSSAAKKVSISSGTYDETNGEVYPFQVTANVAVTGAGAGSTIIRTSNNVVMVKAAAGSSISDVELDGPGTTPTSGRGIDMIGSNVTVKNAVVRGWNEAIDTWSNTTGGLITNVTLSNNSYGLDNGSLAANAVTVRSSTLTGNFSALYDYVAGADLGTSASHGNNYIYCNTGYDLLSQDTAAGTIRAEYNYWDHVPPTQPTGSPCVSGQDYCAIHVVLTLDYAGGLLTPFSCSTP